MTRPRRLALALGYVVAFAVVLLALIAAFGYLGAWELAVAAVLAVPTTGLGDRLVRRAVQAPVEPAAPGLRA